MSASAPPGIEIDRLRAYLDKELPGAIEGELAAALMAGGRSNLTYDLGGRFVLRRPPLGHVLATAHDMGREHRVLSALHGSPVPVPRPVLFCPDPDVIGAPFYVMEKVPGTVYRSGAQVIATLGEDGAAALAAHLVEVLAALHTIDPPAYGLGDFGHPEGFLERQVRRWRKQLDASRSREMPGIDELAGRLAGRIPATQRHSVVHGDYRLENVIVGADGRVAAVLDWEMSTLGDPLTDIGLLRVYWTASGISIVDGMPLVPVERAMGWYERRSGLDLTPLPWYVAFGCFKLAVILEGIHYRFVHGKTVGEGFDQVGPAVAPLVASGLSALDDY